MGQTTLRIDDDLLEEIEEATDEETTRSEWIREAIRMRLGQHEEFEDRLERLEQRVDQLEKEADRSVLERLFSDKI